LFVIVLPVTVGDEAPSTYIPLPVIPLIVLLLITGEPLVIYIPFAAELLFIVTPTIVGDELVM
jgi:hypothetical protein